VSGPPNDVAKAEALLADLIQMAREGVTMGPRDVSTVADIHKSTGKKAAEFLTQPILSSRGHTIRPKTLGQKKYVDAIDANTIVFGIGPAGTGKTYLAMAKAVAALERKEVDRIILTRPAVEAGERLGFLPGTLTDKIDPYLRPLFDALHEMMDPELIPKLLSSGVVEVAPLAYMRGRTLNQSFIILDEAQNTSPEQMKMFLTRLGFGSKMVITGDVTQVDLPGGTSGLKLVGGILNKVDDIHFEHLSAKDVVRHSLVSAIVDAYARHESAKGKDRVR
jgi:phosphate starvation-inducible PhoH-like protein